MLWPDPLVAHPDGNGLRGLKEALGAVRKFFEIHI
jgi:hypothetical protein